jgi:hypothetical protein
VFDDDDPSAAGMADAAPADSVPVDASGLLASFAEAAGGLAKLDVGGLGSDRLQEVLVGVERARRQVDAAALHVAGELDSRGTTDIEHGLATGRWLAREALLPGKAANATVRDGRRLRGFPNVDEALTDGRIGIDHVRVLLRAANDRNATDLDAKASDLADNAQGSRFETWAQRVKRFADLLDDDGTEPSDPDADELHVDRLHDTLHVAGTFHGAAGHRVEEIIAEATDRMWRQAHRDAEATGGAIQVPPRSVLRARAVAELLGVAHTTTSRRAGPCTDLTLHLSGTIGPNGTVRLDQRATTSTGEHLSTSDTQLATCDANTTIIRLDDHGLPLSVGRDERHTTTAQRRALAARDGGCTFPGCHAPTNWCDAHHITHWQHGGTTDLDNLALLCRHHHGVTHRTGWTMTIDAHQRLEWTTPTGHTLAGQRNGVVTRTTNRAGPAPPGAAA